jgi:hypothetical protein
MAKIKAFEHQSRSNFVAWTFGDTVVRKSFTWDVDAVLLRSNQRVLIVECRNFADNVLILDSSGAEVTRVRNPYSRALCFSEGYYVLDELTLISRDSFNNMLAVVINEDGEIIRTYETR